MHVLYITEAISSHDRRFLETISSAGHSAVIGSLYPERDKEKLSEYSRVNCRDQVAIRREASYADVVHAGPLGTAGHLAAQLGLQPLVAASWAYDLLLDSTTDRVAASRVAIALESTTVLLADSEIVERAARNLGYGGRVARFPWGVDLGVFRPQADDPPSPRHNVICTRAWEPLYRVPLVVEAFAAVRESAELRLLNDGSQQREVHQVIDRHNLRERVSLGGHVDEIALASELRSAHVYVSAAMTDGSSVSLLQALATGLPVVASAIPGNEEWLRDSFGAHLVSTDDIASWAAGIRWGLQLTLEERKAIRESHTQLARQRADWTKNARKLVQAYESAAG